MASFWDSDPATVVHRFSLQVANNPSPETSSPEYAQLYSDFSDEHRRRDQERALQRQRVWSRIDAPISNDESNLMKCKTQLQDAMAKFKSLVPSHLQANEEISNWDQVETIVSAVQAQWERKGKQSLVERAKGHFRRMCQGLDNHAGVLKMIPSENNYTSLIVGSVTMIIKASSNYIEISESFAKGVVEINDAVGTVQGQIYDEPDIQMLTMRVYAQVLTYLANFMAWFLETSRTRLLKSFNEKALQFFQGDLVQIRMTTATLAQRINLRMGADVKAIKTITKEMSDDRKYLIRMQQDFADDMKSRGDTLRDAIHSSVYSSYQNMQDNTKETLQNLMQELMRKFVCGDGMTRLLEHQASKVLERISSPVTPMLQESRDERWPKDMEAGLFTATDEIVTSPVATSLPTGLECKHSGANMKLESRHFEDYFDWDNVNPYPEALSDVLVADAAFISRLGDFTTHMDSGVLYGCALDSANPDAPNNLRRAAGQYATLARQRAAVLSYFVQTRHETPPAHRTRESMELCAVLYALLRQVIQHLPARFASSRPMSFAQSRMDALDGTFRTWDEANALLVDLISCLELPLLLLVVDGLNMVEDDTASNSNARLERLVDSLHRAVAAGREQKRIIKVLFTTNGTSRVLNKKLEAKDIVLCHVSPPVTPKKPARTRIY